MKSLRAGLRPLDAGLLSMLYTPAVMACVLGAVAVARGRLRCGLTLGLTGLTLGAASIGLVLGLGLTFVQQMLLYGGLSAAQGGLLAGAAHGLGLGPEAGTQPLMQFWASRDLDFWFGRLPQADPSGEPSSGSLRGAVVGGLAGLLLSSLCLYPATGLAAWALDELLPQIDFLEIPVAGVWFLGAAGLAAWIGLGWGWQGCDPDLPTALGTLALWIACSAVGWCLFVAGLLPVVSAALLLPDGPALPLWWSAWGLASLGASWQGYRLLAGRPPGSGVRVVLVLGLCAGLWVNAQMLLAESGYLFLMAGKSLERRGHVPAALSCYRLALGNRPGSRLDAYLQFRQSLMFYKLGRLDLAEQGFGLMVARYTAEPELSEHAASFLEGLSRNPRAPRHVLAGIETPTEYRDAYCVPDSLGLVLAYWGRPVPARSIGSLITVEGEGTMLLDDVWYCRTQQGLLSYLIGGASPAQVRTWLSQGYPVLLYVPGHVLSAFGFDDRLDTLVAYDVAESEVLTETPWLEALPEWTERERLVGLVAPPDRAASLGEWAGRSRATVQRTLAEYLLEANPEGARRHLARALRERPDDFQAALLADSVDRDTYRHLSAEGKWREVSLRGQAFLGEDLSSATLVSDLADLHVRHRDPAGGRALLARCRRRQGEDALLLSQEASAAYLQGDLLAASRLWARAEALEADVEGDEDSVLSTREFFRWGLCEARSGNPERALDRWAWSATGADFWSRKSVEAVLARGASPDRQQLEHLAQYADECLSHVEAQLAVARWALDESLSQPEERRRLLSLARRCLARADLFGRDPSAQRRSRALRSRLEELKDRY